MNPVVNAARIIMWVIGGIMVFSVVTALLLKWIEPNIEVTVDLRVQRCSYQNISGHEIKIGELSDVFDTTKFKAICHPNPDYGKEIVTPIEKEADK